MVAQLVEHGPFKPGVAGSNPAHLTRFINRVIFGDEGGLVL